MTVVEAAWQHKLAKQIESDLMGELREKAEREAIAVFARNLKDLLLAAPAGQKRCWAWTPACARGKTRSAQRHRPGVRTRGHFSASAAH